MFGRPCVPQSIGSPTCSSQSSRERHGRGEDLNLPQDFWFQKYLLTDIRTSNESVNYGTVSRYQSNDLPHLPSYLFTVVPVAKNQLELFPKTKPHTSFPPMFSKSYRENENSRAVDLERIFDSKTTVSLISPYSISTRHTVLYNRN